MAKAWATLSVWRSATLTIASAQGLTVDRAFLLVDDRPARETIYPAATRHREALDIYVNRSPIAFDIAEHRPEVQADMPVTDSDVRAYLAERWSRSQPKEAALDYVSEGAWRNPSEEERRQADSDVDADDPLQRSNPAFSMSRAAASVSNVAPIGIPGKPRTPHSTTASAIRGRR